MMYPTYNVHEWKRMRFFFLLLKRIKDETEMNDLRKVEAMRIEHSKLLFYQEKITSNTNMKSTFGMNFEQK